jgi:hypothetical protein
MPVKLQRSVVYPTIYLDMGSPSGLSLLVRGPGPRALLLLECGLWRRGGPSVPVMQITIVGGFVAFAGNYDYCFTRVLNWHSVTDGEGRITGRRLFPDLRPKERILWRRQLKRSRPTGGRAHGHCDSVSMIAPWTIGPDVADDEDRRGRPGTSTV